MMSQNASPTTVPETASPETAAPETAAPEVVVAGHICVDVFPAMGDVTTTLQEMVAPGKLTEVGPIFVSTGGCVSNTGLALHRLGINVQLMGKVGGDLFGRALIDQLNAIDPQLATGMIHAPDEPASYTLVLEPPGVDRVFLHCVGPNATFGAADLPLDKVAQARIFHFGYPPILPRMFRKGGAELAAMLESVRARGVTVSLDLSQPDPTTESGRVDWPALLERVLPHVDLFCPNVDELTWMMERPRAEAMRRGESAPDIELLRRLASRMIEWGAAVVMLKLGDRGAYLRTSGDPARIAAMGAAAPANPADWSGRELYTPCFQVQVAGTTGSGDSTVAGLIAALLRGASVDEALTAAVAVGGSSVETPDASTGIPPWEAVQARVAAGWPQHPPTLAGDDWQRAGLCWRPS
jgi:sugar/nucleoside kinase (ribokinase family)